jgi:hypothetical protein
MAKTTDQIAKLIGTSAKTTNSFWLVQNNPAGNIYTRVLAYGSHEASALYKNGLEIKQL